MSAPVHNDSAPPRLFVTAPSILSDPGTIEIAPSRIQLQLQPNTSPQNAVPTLRHLLFLAIRRQRVCTPNRIDLDSNSKVI